MVSYHQRDHPQEKQQHHHDNTQRQQQIQAAFQPIVRVLLNGHKLVRLETDNIVRPFLPDTPSEWTDKGPHSSMDKLQNNQIFAV
jgi:DNA-binding TFAR19-related protein (PDSD5 family)